MAITRTVDRTCEVKYSEGANVVLSCKTTPDVMHISFNRECLHLNKEQANCLADFLKIQKEWFQQCPCPGEASTDGS